MRVDDTPVHKSIREAYGYPRRLSDNRNTENCEDGKKVLYFLIREH